MRLRELYSFGKTSLRSTLALPFLLVSLSACKLLIWNSELLPAQNTPATPLNHAPVPEPQSIDTFYNTDVSITLTASDEDHDALSFWVTTAPAHGSLSGMPPDLVYSPTADFVGTDSFGFTSNDGTLVSPETLITVRINAESPSLSYAGATGTAVNYGSTLTIAPTTLLTNGAIISNCSVQASTTALPAWATLDPSTCVISGTPTSAQGETVYTIIATNSAGASNGATVSMTVNNTAPHAPTVNCDAPIELTTNNVCTVTGPNPSDAESNSITYALDNATTCASAVMGNSVSGTVTYTAPANAATCTIKIKAFDGLLYSLVTSTIITGYGWTAQADVSAAHKFLKIASSTSGDKLVATDGIYIYTSADYGAHWSQRTSNFITGSTDAVNNGPYAPGTNQWTCVASDSTGDLLIATSYTYFDGPIGYGDGYYYKSIDGGDHWSQGNAQDDFGACASSSNGQRLVLWNDPVNMDGGMFSINGGNNWGSNSPLFNDSSYFNSSAQSMRAVASDATGQHLVGVYHGYAYTSTNYGANWTTTELVPISTGVYPEFYDVTISSDGSKLAAVDLSNPGGVWTATLSGGTWTWAKQASVIGWSYIAGSSDGKRLVATPGDYMIDSLYISTDYGVTWTKTASAPIAYWGDVASSADGKHLVTSSIAGRVYTLTLP